MQLSIPRPQPREDGEYKTYVSIGYGDPHGVIHLAEGNGLDLRDIRVDDCERLIRAAVAVKAQLLRYQAMAAAPHGREDLYEGTCQLCGKPQDDELHAGPAAGPCAECGHLACDCAGDMGEDATDSIAGDAAAVLAQSVAAGTPVIVGEDEAERCGARPYPAGSEGDDGTVCMLPKGHDGAHNDVTEDDPDYPDVSGGGVPYPEHVKSGGERVEDAVHKLLGIPGGL